MHKKIIFKERIQLYRWTVRRYRSQRMSCMDDKNFSMNIIENEKFLSKKIGLSIDECDFIYKIILKELCDIDPIKIA